jgi:hypothetical protein
VPEAILNGMAFARAVAKRVGRATITACPVVTASSSSGRISFTGLSSASSAPADRVTTTQERIGLPGRVR